MVFGPIYDLLDAKTLVRKLTPKYEIVPVGNTTGFKTPPLMGEFLLMQCHEKWEMPA